MHEYERIFNARGDSYNNACRVCPYARDTERSLLIDRLIVKPDQKICDVPAGGGYLAEGIARLYRSSEGIICVEPAQGFIDGIDGRFTRVRSSLTDMALRTGAIDRIGSLAGLHHIERKIDFVREAYRVLAPGGMLALGDVQDSTSVSRFLNDAVDRLSATGHKGAFFTEGEPTLLLRTAGFRDVAEAHVNFTWDFPDVSTLVWFCKQLFGLVKAELSDVETELRRFFDIQEVDGMARLPWSLVYAVGTK